MTNVLEVIKHHYALQDAPQKKLIHGVLTMPGLSAKKNLTVLQTQNVAGLQQEVAGVIPPLQHRRHAAANMALVFGVVPLQTPDFPAKITAMDEVRVCGLMRKEVVVGARILVIKKDTLDYFAASAREGTLAMILTAIEWTQLIVYPRTNVRIMVRETAILTLVFVCG